MNISSTPFRRSLLFAALPAALAFASCSDDDDSSAPAQGRLLISHAAASANVQVKALVNTSEVGQLTYGQTTSYLNVNAGSPTLKINVASSNQEAASQVLTVASGQNYSAFAYPLSASTVGLLAVSDDLTAPATGQAKIRVVHVALGAPATVKLSQQTIAGATDVAGINATFPGASAFASVPAGTYSLSVTTGTTSSTVVPVGDGTGTGTGSKNYESGKIYTIVVRGLASSLDPALQSKAVIIANN